MKILSFFYVFFLFFPCCVFAQQGKILSYEIVEEEIKNYELLSPATKKQLPLKQKQQENLIDTIDVYALSDSAKLLILPKMVSIQANFENDKNLNWQEFIQQASQLYGVEKALIWAVIKVESNFIATAVSHKGAVGAMQIMPETQKELGLVNPMNVKDNVFAGTKYLKQQLDFFKGDIALALAGYNAGAGNVLKYQGIPPFKETQQFVKKVLYFMSKACF